MAVHVEEDVVQLQVSVHYPCFRGRERERGRTREGEAKPYLVSISINAHLFCVCRVAKGDGVAGKYIHKICYIRFVRCGCVL